MKYTYRFDPDATVQTMVAASMEMDGLRAQMAPTAPQLRQRALDQLTETNGHSDSVGTRRVLGSGDAADS